MKKLTLHPEDGGAPIEIESPLVRVGRDVTADLCLQDPSVSRQHAEIENRGDGWFIFDLNSSNGVRIEGVLVPEARLTYGTMLRIGQVGFRVEVEGEGESATVVLDRAPNFDPGAERTMLTPPPRAARPRIVVPPPPPGRRAGSRSPDTMGTITVVLVAVALVLAALEAYQTFSNPAAAPVEVEMAAPEIVPASEPAAPAEPAIPSTQTARPTGQATILVATDMPATVSIDGQRGTRVAAGSLKRFKVAPGDHVVQYRGDGWEAEVVAKVGAGEQKLVRPSDDPSVGGGTSPVPTPNP